MNRSPRQPENRSPSEPAERGRAFAAPRENGRRRPDSGRPQPALPVRRPRRIGILLIAVALLFGAAYLAWRLVELQVLRHDEIVLAADASHFSKVTVLPERGMIYDRNRVTLASTTYVYRVGITPKSVRSLKSDGPTPDEIGKQLAAFLELDATAVASALEQQDKPYIQLKKDVRRETADWIKTFLNDWRVGGVRMDPEPRRDYTNGALASQVIGFANLEEGLLVGKLGLEQYYNTTLTGKPGVRYAETDNYGNRTALPFSRQTELDVQNGQSLILNLDINIQKIVQDELAQAVETYAIREGASAIVMDPYTGAILGMSSYPYFRSDDPTGVPPGVDPTRWDARDVQAIMRDYWRNRTISDTYEPGSTFKALTFAAAMEENKTSDPAVPLERNMLSDKPIQVSGATISCSRDEGHGTESAEQAFWRSCNPIFAQLALRLSNNGRNVDQYYRYIRAFGFMSLTAIDLPAEGIGIFHREPTALDMATLSYGESSTVTPIQMISSFAVFANGGYLMKPQMVKAVVNADGATVREFAPETVRQVISEQTVVRMREQLRGVVNKGTGSRAYVEGFSIAGKTSTSTDEKGDHTLSFCGFAPSNDPRVVMLIVLNKPQDKELTSASAAKVFGQTMTRVLEALGTPRVYSDNDISRLIGRKVVPEVDGMSLAQALQTLMSNGLNGRVGQASMGQGTVVRGQWPQAGTELLNRGTVVLYPTTAGEGDSVDVPDFRNRNIGECLSLAAERGVNLEINGDPLGYVVRQDPQPAVPAGAQPTADPTVSPSAGPTAATSGAATGATPTGSPSPSPAANGNPEDQAPTGTVRRGDIIKIYLEAAVEGVSAGGR